MQWRRDRTKGELWGGKGKYGRKWTLYCGGRREQTADRICLPEKHGKHVLSLLKKDDADQSNSCRDKLTLHGMDFFIQQLYSAK